MRFGYHTQSHAPSTGRAEDIYPELRGLAHWAESAGFDYFSVTDHLLPIPAVGPPATPLLDGWLALAAIAQATDRIGLLTLVTNVTTRAPALLARAAATLDLISGGRMLLGIGSGGFRAEYEAYGLDYPAASTRAELLDETAEIVRKLWEQPSVTYRGRHFTLADAVLEPKPLHRPRVLIGGSGALSLRSVARHADMANFVLPGPDGLSALRAALREACTQAGRDPEEIDVSVLDRAIVAPTSKQAVAKWKALGSPERRGYRGLVGSPSDVAGQLRAYESAGASTLMVYFPGRDGESMALFADQVMPSFRA